MHADHYSIPATTKGKRLHPLAIKARGCTALEKGKGGHKKKRRGEKETKRGKTTEKHAEKRKNNGRLARISSPGRHHQHLHEAAAEREEHC